MSYLNLKTRSYLVLLLSIISSASFSQLIPFRVENKWGYANLEGELLTKIQFDSLSIWSVFSNNWNIYENGKMGLVDSLGTIVVPAKFDDIHSFNGKKGVFVKDSTFVFTDNPFTEQFKLTYDTYAFHEINNYHIDSLIAVKKNGSWGILSNANPQNYFELVPTIYDSITFVFEYELAKCYLWKNRKKVLYRTLKSSEISYNEDVRPQTTSINKHPVPPCFDEFLIKDTLGGYCFIWKSCKSDATNKLLSSYIKKKSGIYDSIIKFGPAPSDYLYAVKKNNKWAVWNLHLNYQITAWIYDSIKFLDANNSEMSLLLTHWFVGFKKDSIDIFDILTSIQEIHHSDRFDKIELLVYPMDRSIILIKNKTNWICFDTEIQTNIKNNFIFERLVRQTYGDMTLHFDKNNIVVEVEDSEGISYYINLLKGFSYYLPF